HVALQLADRRLARAALLVAIPQDERRLLVGVAERPDAGKEQRPVRDLGEECFAQGPRRTPRREVDGGEGKSERIRLRPAWNRQVAGEDGSCQCGEERRRRRNSVEPEALF